MYTNIPAALYLNDETSWRAPLLAAVDLAQLHVLAVPREVEAILQAKTSPLAYDMVAADLESGLGRLIRQIEALHPKTLVAHGVSTYAEILRVAEEAGAELIVVGSHRPVMKDYLLGANASRVMRRAACPVLVPQE
jgi:nucleotide-binding universal stress UspA family protein